MAKAPTLPPVLHPKDEIQFVASHRPGLEDGKYTLEIQQVIESSPAQKISEKSFKATRAFWVLGPQFTLDPQVVHAVFPPAGSRGNFWNVLPHVILNRSTLPWERSACDAIHEKDKRPPWLLLLLFDQSDAPRPQQVKLGDLKNPLTTPALWPGIGELEPGQHENDKVQVIDVPWSTLKNLLPTTLADFTYRTHARVVSQYLFTLSSGTNGLQDFSGDIQQLHGGQFPDELKDLLNKKGTVLSDHLEILTLTQDQRWRITDVGKARHYEIYKPASKDVFNVYEVESERAVLIGNRLPKPGTRNVAHLISVEDRYTSTNMGDNIAFKKATVLPGKKVRLVSLKHWEFFCLDETKTFKGLLEGLNGRTPVAAIDRGKVDLPGPLTQPTVTIEPGGLVAGSTLAVVAQDSQGKILDTGQIRKRQIQNAKDASHTLANLKSGTLNGRIVDTARELLPAAHPGASHAEAPPVAVIVNGKIAPILSSGTFQHERIIEGRNQAGKAPYGLVVEAATNDGKVLASGTITVGQIQNARDDKGKKISNASSLNGQLFLESSSTFHVPYQHIQAPRVGKIVGGQVKDGTLYNGAIEASLIEDGKDQSQRSLPRILIEAKTKDGKVLVSGTITNGHLQNAKDNKGDPLDSTAINGVLFEASHGAARAYLKSGFVPLPHYFRQGDRSIS